MKILLDAGHGGNDPGAIHETETQTLRECDITLEVVSRMHDVLRREHPDWEVILTRVDDTYFSPSYRATLIKEHGVDAAISVHCNSSANQSAQGHETLYRDEVDFQLAQAMNHQMSLNLDNRDRGLKNDITDLGRKLAILNTPDVPTVIVEPAFLSNDEDREILLDYSSLADVLVFGIERWVAAEGF